MATSNTQSVTTLPSGGGSISGLGETFAADPYTGTGRYSLPISLPSGHAGFTPSLALTYSSGAGAGVCGVGWSFGVSSIRRRLDKGQPSFTMNDRFLLGDDELIPTAKGYYRRSTEGSFARIRFVNTSTNSFWAVTNKRGNRSIFGHVAAHRDGETDRTTVWRLSEQRDIFDNKITYHYERDEAGRRSYLNEIHWANGAYRVKLNYEQRPDVLRSARAGFIETTSKRLVSVQIQVLRSDTGVFATFEQYDFKYELSEVTQLSRLVSVTKTFTHEDGTSSSWPPITFDYVSPKVSEPKHLAIVSHPTGSLNDSRLRLLDLDANGLPDLIQSTTNGHLVWKNQGNGRFSAPVPINGPTEGIEQQGVFFADMRGTGLSDWVTKRGYFPNLGNGTFGGQVALGNMPMEGIEGANVRFSDLTGDGVGDILVRNGSQFQVYKNKKGTGFAHPSSVNAGNLPSFSDPWVRFADTTGDGFSDIVVLDHGGATIWAGLGQGRFASPRKMTLPYGLSTSISPDRFQLTDLTGTGAADLIVKMPFGITVFPNGSGEGFGQPFQINLPNIATSNLSFTDLSGTATRGILVNNASEWRFVDPFQGEKPDTLARVENGFGKTTEFTFSSSVAEWLSDQSRGISWKHRLPFAVSVVKRIVSTDTVTGYRTSQSFAYHEGYFDTKEREFRGFAMVDVTDVDGIIDGRRSDPNATVKSSRQRSYFSLGNGDTFERYYAVASVASPKIVIPNEIGAQRALRGAVLRTEVFEDADLLTTKAPLSVTMNGYEIREVLSAQNGYPGSFQVVPTESTLMHTEKSTTERRIVTTTSEVDSKGRITRQDIVAKGRLKVTSDAIGLAQSLNYHKYTLTTYVELDGLETDDYDGPYTPNYLIDFVSTVEAYGMIEGEQAELLNTQHHFYDGEDSLGLGHPDTTSLVGISQGKLSCTLVQRFTESEFFETLSSPGALTALDDRGEMLLSDGSYWVQTGRQTYDSRGMVLTAMDPRGFVSTITYDTTHGLFAESTVDALGHPIVLERGPFPFQVLASIDANNNRTEVVYNAYGLVAQTSVMGKESSLGVGDWSGDPASHPTSQFEYDFFNTPVKITAQSRQERLGRTLTTVQYLGGSGAVIQERHQAEEDPLAPGVSRFRVSGWQVLDVKGQVIRSYQPEFSGTSDYSRGSEAMAFVSTEYDRVRIPANNTLNTIRAGLFVRMLVRLSVSEEL